MTDYAADLVEWLHIHHFVCQHLNIAIAHMNAHYNQLANSAGFEEGDRVWLYPHQRGKSPKTLSPIKRSQCADRGSEAVSCSWEQA